MGDRDRSPYGVVRVVPSCAIWNFLDNELEIDIPLMNVERLCKREVMRGSEADDDSHDQGTPASTSDGQDLPGDV